MAYLIQCFYYGEIYHIENLHKKSLDSILPYKPERYVKNKHYMKLPEKKKRELTETRLLTIEKDVRQKTTKDSRWFTDNCETNLFQ